LALPYGPLSSFFPGRRVRNAEAAAAVKLNDVMDLLNLPRRMLDVRVDSLSLGQQKKVEVARAIVRGPRLLLLDEPAGGLNDRETSDFSASLRGLQRELLLSVVLIDHDMNLVMDICDRLCVLSFGKLIAEGTPAEVQENSDVISVYLGDALAA
jgi:branched-chain amino acid transport system ATP-binding protein